MSNSTKGRVDRKQVPDKVFTLYTYGDALPYLLLDFAERCAYSMRHISRCDGKLTVDHFNPRKKKNKHQYYDNLFPATHRCNRAKSDTWPTKAKRDAGHRFLNCCEEQDYGTHIFEDPDTHKLVGLSKEGRFHILHCQLNDKYLVQERAERAELWNLLENRAVKIKNPTEVLPYIEKLRQQAEKMIFKIPYLSGAALDRHRAFEKAVEQVKRSTESPTS